MRASKRVLHLVLCRMSKFSPRPPTVSPPVARTIRLRAPAAAAAKNALLTAANGAPRRAFRTRLLRWYDAQRRSLPWRADHDPYRVWVAEIMLQQTRVAAVVERYGQFLRRFPSVRELARAPLASVLALWSGLGITGGRARCTLPRAKSWPTTAAVGLIAPPLWCVCRALAVIPRPPSPALPSASAVQWWTAMWSGCCSVWRALACRAQLCGRRPGNCSVAPVPGTSIRP